MRSFAAALDSKRPIWGSIAQFSLGTTERRSVSLSEACLLRRLRSLSPALVTARFLSEQSMLKFTKSRYTVPAILNLHLLEHSLRHALLHREREGTIHPQEPINQCIAPVDRELCPPRKLAEPRASSRTMVFSVEQLTSKTKVEAIDHEQLIDRLEKFLSGSPSALPRHRRDQCRSRRERSVSTTAVDASAIIDCGVLYCAL